MGVQPRVDTYRMHVLQALLYLCLMAAPECTSLPISADSVRNNVQHIVNIANITLVHIKTLRTRLPEVQRIEVTSPSIGGLVGITRDLGRLDNELMSLFIEDLRQIQADVSSIEGRVHTFALTMDCAVQARPGAESSNDLFPETLLYLVLMKVQHYLEKLIVNQDKLKVC